MRFILTLSVCSLLALSAAYPAWATSEEAAGKPATEATASGEAPAAPATDAPAADAAAESAPAADRAITEEAKPQTEHAAAEGHEAAAGGHETIKLPQVDWSFEGAFGTFDRPSMQRGFQVYKQVCAACHGLNRLSYRNLAALGYNEGEIKAFAAEATVTDEHPNDEGEMFERPGRPADRFKSPFANEEAARYANNGALPPDLSLITRARHDGSNYVHALLTGFSEAPAGFTVNEGMHYNKYFAGHQIAMAPPLSDDVVTFDDGTPATVDQMARDVTTFLTWAGEPVMKNRKQVGIKVIIFLSVFSVLMYLTKRKIWKDMH